MASLRLAVLNDIMVPWGEVTRRTFKFITAQSKEVYVKGRLRSENKISCRIVRNNFLVFISANRLKGH